MINKLPFPWFFSCTTITSRAGFSFAGQRPLRPVHAVCFRASTTKLHLFREMKTRTQNDEVLQSKYVTTSLRFVSTRFVSTSIAPLRSVSIRVVVADGSGKDLSGKRAQTQRASFPKRAEDRPAKRRRAERILARRSLPGPAAVCSSRQRQLPRPAGCGPHGILLPST
jgi:hypothetical protein